MYANSLGSCCGVGDIGELNLPSRLSKTYLQGLIRHMESDQGDKEGTILSIYVFGDKAKSKGANRLANYIKKRPEIGTVTEFGPFNNPRHNSSLKLWVWELPKGMTGPKMREVLGLPECKMVKNYWGDMVYEDEI